ncbi:hypothetical protein M885DRAFT_514494 [Pelagophyceae sp. CCMP2097]|nr:hypothetical protein M885DRAFT_514494 [Pelagophyceae sp. CCMP2097]|mmetsp:Transcript_26353/g.93980  ORF Transcript_26353/g.93980 Transcript_26353/m.93980 type:complete len:217 (-) Transcript_26353:83-733(-)
MTGAWATSSAAIGGWWGSEQHGVVQARQTRLGRNAHRVLKPQAHSAYETPSLLASPRTLASPRLAGDAPAINYDDTPAINVVSRKTELPFDSGHRPAPRGTTAMKMGLPSYNAIFLPQGAREPAPRSLPVMPQMLSTNQAAQADAWKPFANHKLAGAKDSLDLQRVSDRRFAAPRRPKPEAIPEALDDHVRAVDVFAPEHRLRPDMSGIQVFRWES